MSDAAAAWDGDPESAALQALLRDVAPALCRDRRVLRATAARVQPAPGTPLAAVAAALLDDYFAHASADAAAEPPAPAPATAAAADRGLAEARGRQAALFAARRAHTPPVGSQQTQLRAARLRAQARWAASERERTRAGRVCTLAQLRARDEAREQAAAAAAAEESASSRRKGGLLHTIASFNDPENIGRRALELTNEFRARNGLGALRWSQALCDIGAGHSRDMAEGRVAFGHDGFRARMARMPGGVCTAAENVAMNYGTGDVAKTAVRGWIESPGHRRNLLGAYSECGIGVHAHGGRFYLTQLFAQR